MANKKPPEGGHVVKEYLIDNTRVAVYDDACRNTTKEQNEALLARIANIALRAQESAVNPAEQER